MPNYSIKPELLGFYCLYDGYKYTEDVTIGLKYFKKPSPGFCFNLSDGFDPQKQVQSKGDKNLIGVEPERGSFRTRDVANWMSRHPELIKDDDGNLKIDFVCEMGLLKIILNLPYSNDEADKTVFAVSKYKGIVFIERKTPMERRADIGDHAGRRFEELVTEPLKTHDIYGGCLNVMKIEIGSHQILYSCEVDCIKEKKDPQDLKLSDMVELKSGFRMVLPRQFEKFNRIKSRQWWSQCAFSGVKEIYVGINDNDYGRQVCKSIDIVETQDLPKLGRDHWKPDTCLEYVERFFNEVTKYVTEDDRNSIHLFEVNPFKITRIPPEDVNLEEYDLIFRNEELIEKIDLLTT